MCPWLYWNIHINEIFCYYKIIQYIFIADLIYKKKKRNYNKIVKVRKHHNWTLFWFFVLFFIVYMFDVRKMKPSVGQNMTMVLCISVVLFYLSSCSLFESINPSFYNLIIRSIHNQYHSRVFISLIIINKEKKI